MEVRFGNLTVQAFEAKTKVEFSEEDRKWMEERRTDTADFQNNDKFHIFDMPLGIVAGDNVGPELIKRLRGYTEYKRHFYVETRLYVNKKEAPDTELPF